MSAPRYAYWILATAASPDGLTFDGETSFSEPEEVARTAETQQAGDREQLEQENAIYPWLADGSMADPPED